MLSAPWLAFRFQKVTRMILRGEKQELLEKTETASYHKAHKMEIIKIKFTRLLKF